MKINLALVDDHILLRNGLAELLNNQLEFNVLFEASNGKDCIEKLDNTNLPQVILMDINMPIMDGFETTKWLTSNYPSIKVLALSMYDSENNIIKMLRCGAKGYLLKDTNPKELINAILTLSFKGIFANDLLSSKMIKAIHQEEIDSDTNQLLNKKLTDRELEFLKHCCTELGYKEIATLMNVSPRTIDGYREGLFEKLDIHTRVGLVLYAIKNGIFVV